MTRTAIQLRPRCAGLTLAELSTSLAIIATLMVAIGSVMVLTGRAVGMSATQAAEVQIDDVVGTFASEHRMALTVTERTPTSITFTVADRNGDGAPETIRYAWSGVAGDPLTRTLNNALPAVVAKGVKKFQLGYLTQTAPAAAPPEVESTTDDLVYSYEVGTTSAYTMSMTGWPAQSFVPTLARANATSWRVTQVQLMASRAVGSTAQLAARSWTVSLCASDALGKPNFAAPIEQQTLTMTGLSTGMAWSPVISFTNAAQNLSPTQQYWIVVSQSILSTTGSVGFDSASTATANPFAATSTSGTSWATFTGRDMKIRVYGRYKYLTP